MKRIARSVIQIMNDTLLDHLAVLISTVFGDPPRLIHDVNDCGNALQE